MAGAVVNGPLIAVDLAGLVRDRMLRKTGRSRRGRLGRLPQADRRLVVLPILLNGR